MSKTAYKPVNSADRERLLIEFAPMVKHIAQRLAFRLPPSIDIDDLIHAGMIGLMDAIGKYDPLRRTRFKTYAEFRIRGAMLDEIRSQDWAPRSVRDKIGLLQKTVGSLEKHLGRPPSDEEIAKKLEMSLEEFNSFLFEARGVALFSLDDTGLEESSPSTLLETLTDVRAENPLLSLLAGETKDTLIDGIKKLPEKERLVIALYYQDELTMKEIGQAMGITESRVCQLHTQAILRLKAKLGGTRAE